MSEFVNAFGKFALAFEESFASDDWSAVGAGVADDLVWVVSGPPEPFGGAFVGREGALRAIEESVDAFDRRFDQREPQILEGPTPIPGGVHLTWVVTYRREGIPPFELLGEEWDFFGDGKLELHRERIHNAGELAQYLMTHAEALRPA